MNAIVDFPFGWKKTTLGELFEFQGGGTPSKKVPEYWDGDLPWASVKDIKQKYLFKTIDSITELGLKKSASNVAELGSLLLLTRIEPGKAAIPKCRVAVNQDCKIAVPKDGVDIEWAYYFFLAHEREFLKLSSGTTVLGIRLSELKSMPIRLPPLNEQRRIVAEIEALFSELDKGVESLETARAQVKTYRQSLLEDALRGKLSPDVEEVPLGALIGQINQGWSPKCELNRSPSPGEWAVIKTTAVQPMEYMGEEAKPLPHGLEPRPAIAVKAGDFLMTRKGPRSRTGVSCLVRSTRDESMLCDTVYRFRCDETKVDPEYLEMALNAPSSLHFIDSQKSGISDSGISLNQKKVKAIPIWLPSGLEAQKKIVGDVKKKLSKLHCLEVEVDKSLVRVDALRQSVLKRAFEGKLVPQDPNDEPASVPLERIRRKQVDQPKTTRRKRKAEASV